MWVRRKLFFKAGRKLIMYGSVWYSGTTVPDIKEDFCQATIKLKDTLGKQEGTVNNGNRDIQVRSNKNFTIDSPEFKTLVFEWTKKANEEQGWNYDVTGIENLQLSEYNIGDKYSWHLDIRPEDPCRKLSFNVVLNEDNEGGDFQFSWGSPSASYKRRVIAEPQLKLAGRMIVFPSYYYHRVKPVTKGIRYSLTGWITGQPFR